MHKLLVLNIGSTSTKLAYYEAEKRIHQNNIEHDDNVLQLYPDVFDQFDFRKDCVLSFIQENQIDITKLDAIVSRGGHTEPIEGGVYTVNEVMLAQQRSGLYGKHPCDLGAIIAFDLVKETDVKALVLDTPVTDEFHPLARLSGHPLFPRRSSFHALSHKATAKRYAREKGLKYEELSLIVAHLGGGISVAPHKNGRMIDGDNGLAGDGAFSTNRTGALPVGSLVDACYSGDYTHDEMKKIIQGKGGLYAYTGTVDVRVVLQLAETSKKDQLALDAMIYQACKQIGAMATVLQGKIDAILLTGGIVYSDYVVQRIKQSCSFLGEIIVYPGENEMESLAIGALDALNGNQPIKEFVPKIQEEVV